jgi:HD superfamily phosphohydrolase
MNLKKIVDVFSINHDGTIINIEKENNDLNIDIEINYLANYINKSFTIIKYKIINFKKMELIDLVNYIKYENITEIKSIEVNINNAEIGEDENIIIHIWSEKNKIYEGKLYLWADDIKIFDQDNHEIEYYKLNEICKKYWNDWKKKWNK